MAIEAERLTVSRLGRVVLREVSVGIADGECVSIIGPNGAGKSTLMMALLGLLPLDGGTVRLDGVPLDRLRRRTIARKVSYVPQIHDGYLGFRARDIVGAGRFAHLDPLEPLSSEDRRAVAEAAAACRIDDLMDRTVDTLSGGERQKVWIAAALAQQAPAMFLDEPTNALDPSHQAELIRIMRKLSAAGQTLLVICHDLNLPVALGGRVIALRDHGIAFDGPVGQWFDPDHLGRLFGTEFVRHHASDGEGWSIQLQL